MFSCNLPPIGIWQNGRDRLHATAIKTGWPERILDKESAQKVTLKKTMGDLAADRPAWWRWAYLGL